MNDKTIYDLELHEEMKIRNDTHVVRVPGGWIYKFFRYKIMTTTFVPYFTEYTGEEDWL